METKTKQNGEATQGVDQPLPKASQVEKWIERDVIQCINFLQTINSDPDLRRTMATWMLGRMQNQRNQEALKKQSDLFADAK